MILRRSILAMASGLLACSVARGQGLVHTTAVLSEARYMPAATAVGQMALFGGGDSYGTGPRSATVDIFCKGRSKTVARGGRRDFVALLGKDFRSFGWDRPFPMGWRHRSGRRESNRSVYGHDRMDGRSPGGVG